MASPEGESALLEAARSGDGQALELLLSRYQPLLYRFGLRMCRHDQDAQDVVQDTLLAATRGLRDFRGAASLSTWLYTITRSFCIKKRRRGKGAPGTEVSLEASEGRPALETRDPARGPEELAQTQELRAQLELALRGLEVSQREVLLLRDVEGLTAQEVAGVTGLSVEAVKSRLHRARVALRKRLAPLLQYPAGPAATTCPDVLAAFERHLEGELLPAACAELERHLAACERCRGMCDALKQTLKLCQELEAPQVPARLQAAIRDRMHELLAAQR